MILTCPACSARYLIAGDAIGDQGRVVRCGKCGHNWDQAPVHDSLDELSRQGSEDYLNNAQEPDDGGVEAAVASFLNDTIPEGVKPFPAEPSGKMDKPLIKAAQLPREPKVIPKSVPVITGVVVALAVFATIVAITIASRVAIMNVMPFTKPVFVALGFEEAGDSRTLVFDGITAKIEGNTLAVTGSLINLSASTMTLPPMVVDVLDSSAALVKTLPAPIEQKALSGEQSIDINVTFENIPEAAAQARLRFMTEEEGQSKSGETETSAPTTDAADADNTHAPPEAASDHPPAHE